MEYVHLIIAASLNYIKFIEKSFYSQTLFKLFAIIIYYP